jgi:hypothetical protein
MATEAQVSAHPANAQKSADPGAAEGTAQATRNAGRYGVLAREGVLRGEDWEEWQSHREMLLEELRPVGALEVFLAARVIDLTWRLHRAAQDQNEVFGALYERHTAGGPEPAGPAERGATLGRMVLEDFSGEAVLERLLRHERRIESSLYQTLNELRRVHDQGRKADQETLGTLARWRDEDDQARKARAFAFCRPADPPAWPAGGTTNAPRSEVSQPCDIPSRPETRPPADVSAEDEICETNPIPEGIGVQGSGISDLAPNPQPLAPALSCETNPIRAGLDMGQVLCDTVVMSDSAQIGPRKTNPICAAAGGTGIPSASLSGQALSMSWDHGRDAHATRPPAGGTTSPARGQSCETNPICGPGSILGNRLSGHNGPTWHGRLAPAASAGRRCHEIHCVWEPFATAIHPPGL